MSGPSRTEATLPSLVASLSADYGREVLSLTILFHPDPERIGEFWEEALKSRKATLELGRFQPEFRHAGQPPRALEENHVSRATLTLTFSQQGLGVARHSDACRCRLDGEGIGEEALSLTMEQAARGCVLQLGHAVVLWLHAGPARGDSPDGLASTLVGGGAAMCALRQQIVRTGATDLDALILGETGSGKEEVATALHRASPRAAQTMLAINMAAIPESLAPSLLFGNARGAFTGAGGANPGYFRQAEGGTLFMDEIGAVAPEVQPQLLRVLQQRQVQVVGGGLEPVNVRVIAATDSELDAEDCTFSAALRHRLSGIELHVPALRSHREDIGQLLLHFLRREAPALGAQSLLPGHSADPRRIARWAELFQRFALYTWPGNVRELANSVRQLLVQSDTEPELPAALEARLTPVPESPSAAEPGPAKSSSIDDATLRQAYIDSHFEVAATARRLSLSRQAIYRRLEEHRDFRQASQVPDEELDEALAAAGGDVRQAALALQVSASGLRARLRRRKRQ